MAAITNWLMGATATPESSATVVIRMGRRASAELNEAQSLGAELVEYVDPSSLFPITAVSLTATDTEPHDGRTNGGSGYQFEVVDPNPSYTYTWTAIYSGAATDTVADIDNDQSDSIRMLVVTGLPADTTHEFHIRIAGSTTWGSCVKVRVRTLPSSGEIRVFKVGCSGQFADSDWYAEKDRYSWLAYARKIHVFDPHYVLVPDDANYANEVGHSSVQYNVPINSSSDIVINQGLVLSTSNPAQSFDRGSAATTGSSLTDDNLSLINNISMAFHHPGYSALGKHRQIMLTPGDHGYMPGNNFAHGDAEASDYFNYASITEMVSAYRLQRRLWMRTLGALMPPSYYVAPGSPEFPKGISVDASGNPVDPVATYGAEAEDYYPWSFIYPTHLHDDICRDWLSQRSPEFDDSAGAVFFSAKDTSDLAAALTGYSKPYICFSNEKQMALGHTNNRDGPRAYTPNPAVLASNATADVLAFYNEMNGHSRCPIVACSDSHYMQTASVSNTWFELNHAPVDKRTVTGSPIPNPAQRAGDSTSKPSLDELFDRDTNAQLYDSDYVTQYRDGTDNAVSDTDESQTPTYGFGGAAHIFDSQVSRHAILNHEFLPVGDVYEVAANSSTFTFASSSVREADMVTLKTYVPFSNAVGAINAVARNRFGVSDAGDGLWAFRELDTGDGDPFYSSGILFNNNGLSFDVYDDFGSAQAGDEISISAVRWKYGSDASWNEALAADFGTWGASAGSRYRATGSWESSHRRHLPIVTDASGNITVVDNGGLCQFDIDPTGSPLANWAEGDHVFIGPNLSSQLGTTENGIVAITNISGNLVTVNTDFQSASANGDFTLYPVLEMEIDKAAGGGGAGGGNILSNKIIGTR